MPLRWTGARHDRPQGWMILVAAPSLWCSLSVHGAGLRIEAMRFGLLVVLTVALLSVAFRINAHHTSSSAGPSSPPTAQPTAQSTGQPTGQPTGPTSGPPTSPGTSTGSSAGHPHHAGGSGQATSGQPASGQPTSGQQGAAGNGPQILPVTGWDSTVKLGALAFLLIGGGTLAMRVGAPRRQRPDTLQD